MKRAVVIGGFAESERLLEPVGHAICDAGIAEDADIFVFREAIDAEPVINRATRNQLVVTHSAGIMAIKPYSAPELLVAFNGPEPRRVGRLVLSALAKSANHVRASVTGPNRSAHLRTFLGNNAELLAHPLGNLSQLKRISQFSTSARLDKFSGWGWAVRAVSSENDEFFSPLINPEDKFGHMIISGGHDELLVNPRKVISKTFPENS